MLPARQATAQPQLLARPDGEPWHPAAAEMWRAVCSSPMGAEFDASDLHALLRLLDLVHIYWSLPPEKLVTKVQLAAEIRLESQAFGLTPLDRRRLQWEIERVEEAQASARRPRPRKQADPRL